jgi:hypothetical protein
LFLNSSPNSIFSNLTNFLLFCLGIIIVSKHLTTILRPPTQICTPVMPASRYSIWTMEESTLCW